jgi:CRP-like cAMP-binding protein
MAETAAGICRRCPSRDCGLCRAASSSDPTLLQGMRLGRRTVPTGADLFRQGDACGEAFNIVDGWAFLYELLEDGRRQILQFALPGDLIGFQPGERAFPFGAQALGSVEVCVVPMARLMAAARHHGELALGLACMLSNEGALAYGRLTSVGRKTAQERCASLLLELFTRLRRRAPEAPGETLRIPLTQTHIADALGLTPVHINRTLSLLRQKGVIDYGQGVFHILDPDRLLAIAGTSPAARARARGQSEWLGLH